MPHRLVQTNPSQRLPARRGALPTRRDNLLSLHRDKVLQPSYETPEHAVITLVWDGLAPPAQVYEESAPEARGGRWRPVGAVLEASTSTYRGTCNKLLNMRIEPERRGAQGAKWPPVAGMGPSSRRKGSPRSPHRYPFKLVSACPRPRWNPPAPAVNCNPLPSPTWESPRPLVPTLGPQTTTLNCPPARPHAHALVGDATAVGGDAAVRPGGAGEAPARRAHGLHGHRRRLQGCGRPT
jgi:hypothetical protein